MSSATSRRYQQRNLAAGLCVVCPRPRVNAQHCEEHRESRRAFMRRLRSRAAELAKLGCDEAQEP